MKKPFDEIPRLEGARIVLKKLGASDADALRELTRSARVYRYLPTFLCERQSEDMRAVIREMYDRLFAEKESLILGVFQKEDGAFCGLAELYGWRDEIHKISLGYRLLERYWGRGIATEAVELLVDYLNSETDVGIITASTMVENQASANVLRKNGFLMTAAAVGEDWGFDTPTIADKWFR